jgi:hypothetical protein
MALPTELRCEIYRYLLTVEHGITYAAISPHELKFRAAVRKLWHDDVMVTMHRKLIIASHVGLQDWTWKETSAISKYNSESEPLLHANILCVNKTIHDEARDIIYEQNAISIDPNTL